MVQALDSQHILIGEFMSDNKPITFSIPEMMLDRAREIKVSAWSYQVTFYIDDQNEFVFDSDCLVHVGSGTKPYIGLQELEDWVLVHSTIESDGRAVVNLDDIDALILSKKIALDAKVDVK
jgi:hypothetical protein